MGNGESPSVYREMAKIIARFAEQDEEVPTAIGNLYLNRRSSPTQPVHTAQWPCFALVVQGAKSLALGQSVYRYGIGEYLVVSVDLPVASRVTKASKDMPHLGFGLRIDAERLQDLLRRIRLPASWMSPSTMRGVAVHKAPRELLDATLRLLRLLERPHDIQAMAPLYEQEILYRLLMGPFGPTLLTIATTETPSNKIARAVRFLRETFREPLRVGVLARRVGMSVSSLHHHFKAVTATTPIQYQKRLRLHEARRLLLVERCDVGTAGYRVGYESPSQFSREYRRLYKVSPLHDLRSSRARSS
jgi:AraC-like DNA-binding protein